MATPVSKLTRRTFNDIVSNEATINMDGFDIKQTKLVFNKYITINQLDAFDDVIDFTHKQHSNMYLTSDNILSNFIKSSNDQSGELPNTIYSKIKILKKYLVLEDCNVTIDGKAPVDVNDTTENYRFLGLSDTESNGDIFKLYFLENNYLAIVYISNEGDEFYLACNGSNESHNIFFMKIGGLEYEEYCDMPYLFKYYIDISNGTLLISKLTHEIDSSGKHIQTIKYITTNPNETTLELQKHNPDLILKNMMFHLNVDYITPKPLRYNTSVITYNNSGELTVDVGRANDQIESNYIFYKSGDLRKNKFDVIELKNIANRYGDIMSNNIVASDFIDGFVPVDSRVYTSFAKDIDAQLSETLSLNYAFYYQDILIDSTESIFKTTKTLYPFKSLGINDTKFYECGAFSFSSPEFADKLYSYDDNSINVDGHMLLCTWLSGSPLGNEAIWMDRYYVPDINSHMAHIGEDDVDLKFLTFTNNNNTSTPYIKFQEHDTQTAKKLLIGTKNDSNREYSVKFNYGELVKSGNVEYIISQSTEINDRDFMLYKLPPPTGSMVGRLGISVSGTANDAIIFSDIKENSIITIRIKHTTDNTLSIDINGKLYNYQNKTFNKRDFSGPVLISSDTHPAQVTLYSFECRLDGLIQCKYEFNGGMIKTGICHDVSKNGYHGTLFGTFIRQLIESKNGKIENFILDVDNDVYGDTATKNCFDKISDLKILPNKKYKYVRTIYDLDAVKEFLKNYISKNGMVDFCVDYEDPNMQFNYHKDINNNGSFMMSFDTNNKPFIIRSKRNEIDGGIKISSDTEFITFTFKVYYPEYDYTYTYEKKINLTYSTGDNFIFEYDGSVGRVRIYKNGELVDLKHSPKGRSLNSDLLYGSIMVIEDSINDVEGEDYILYNKYKYSKITDLKLLNNVLREDMAELFILFEQDISTKPITISIPSGMRNYTEEILFVNTLHSNEMFKSTNIDITVKNVGDVWTYRDKVEFVKYMESKISQQLPVNTSIHKTNFKNYQ